jgi:hypothetical protein
MQQWTNVHGIDQTPDISETVAGYPRRVFTDSAGVPRVETWTITGMGHGTPVDPGTGETQCGIAGAYILDVNICSSWYIARFFGLDNLDSTPPSVSITAPAAGATVSGNTTVSADASDAVGVARVDFLLDGALIGTDAVAPYSVVWDASTAANGTRTLTARAVDLVGNEATSAPVPVTVTGGTSGGTPVTVTFSNEDSNDGYVKANADGSAPAVGTLEALSGLAIGRGTDAKFNRSVLSFDTAAIPDGATITSASVSVTYRSASGDPWSNPAGNTLLVDVRNGCLGACTIETGDWAAIATAAAAAQVPAFSGGSQQSTVFSAAGLAAINRAGRTQLRLRFSANQTATAYVWIDRGASARLSVTYQP